MPFVFERYFVHVLSIFTVVLLICLGSLLFEPTDFVFFLYIILSISQFLKFIHPFFLCVFGKFYVVKYNSEETQNKKC